MPSSLHRPRRSQRGSALLVFLALLISPLALAAPAAAAPATHLVISEVYGGGGNSGAQYTHDFVELYNPTASPIDLTGLSLQYRSSGGTGAANGVHVLSGSVAAGGYFLAQEAVGSGGTTALPTPDATGDLAMSGTNGVVYLANSTTALTLTPGSITSDPNVVDLVGYGSANTYETAATPVLSNTTAAARGTVTDDSDDNSADFSTGAPTPEGSGGGVDPQPAEEKTIAEIQGTGDVSPLVGSAVITEGFVTAAYPEGGFNGFYLQTAGTGGALDFGTHNASDAVFVYAGNMAAVDYPAVGDQVSVTGDVSEFFGMTEVSIDGAGDIEEILDPAAAPTPVTNTWPGGESARESMEGMLYEPSGAWTVSEVYRLNQYGEITLARGNEPARQPTDVARPGSPAANAVASQNAARKLLLDDGSTANYFTTAKDTPLPWITPSVSVRVGASVSFPQAGILDYRNSAWKLQPTGLLTAGDTNSVQQAEFTETRTSGPEPVEGDLKVASFNVLNYFTETAADYEAADAANECTSYTDRVGTPIAVNSCTPNGPRGAWDATNRARQQDKIVAAINALGADVLSLEEIENSVVFGHDRDAALSTLVDALNTDAGSPVWSSVDSPAPGGLPALGDQDVIRTAFIYKSAAVEPVGTSRVLVGSAAFGNAREPLAQVFKPAGGEANQQFMVVVNHFKSKGSGSGEDADMGDGQGASNASRVKQATALVDWVDQLKVSTATERVFLTGDFNAYTAEDPMQVLYDAGYTDIGSTLADDYTYVFDGAVGSLDHVLANGAAMAGVQGASVWNINSVESVAYEYSRYNYNATDFYAPNPFRSSDHDPLLVGFDLPAADADVVPLNLLNINDFHGRIDSNTTKFATTVEQLREAGGEDNTLFLSAGDNIGASLFASATADDNPTIDMLNELELATAAVGNHEFDKGFSDLTGHVQTRADWTYLGANVYDKGTTTPALPEYAILDRDGIKVGVIGVVTEETPALVSPGGITDLDFGDPVAAVNRVADQLTDGNEANGEADVIVAEFHEGAPHGTPDGSSLEEEVAAGTAFGDIVTGVSADVDAIFTGHTHKEYAWDAPVPGEEGVTRPIMQTGEYGNNVGQVRLFVDTTTMEVESYTQAIVHRAASEDTSYPRVAAVKTIVDDALADAAVIGNEVKGSVTEDITTAYGGGSYVDGEYVGPNSGAPKEGRDKRELESALGNKVADALLSNLSENGAEISLVNPGGLRDELFYDQTGSEGDGNVTYAEANAVLPFVNNLWTIDLTGAQVKTVLEQQWQPSGSSRPFLHLGLSSNMDVLLDPSMPEGERVRSVLIDGEPLDPAAMYTVGTFSFLATGGDNFTEFRNGSNAVDTGKVDRDAWIDYIENNSPLTPSFERREVEGSGFPESIAPGEAVEFDLTRLDLTSIGSPLNTTAEAVLHTDGGDTALGSFPVTDGAATVSFTAPAEVPEGATYVITAQPSGTTVTIPAAAADSGPAETSTSASVNIKKPIVRKGRPTITATVKAGGAPVDGGTIEVVDGGIVLGSSAVAAGVATVKLPKFTTTGKHVLTVRYLGTDEAAASSATVAVTVVKAAAKLTVKAKPGKPKKRKKFRIIATVKAPNGPVSGYVAVREKGELIALVQVKQGKAVIRMPAERKPGLHKYKVSYLGSDYVKAKTVFKKVRIRK